MNWPPEVSLFWKPPGVLGPLVDCRIGNPNWPRVRFCLQLMVSLSNTFGGVLRDQISSKGSQLALSSGSWVQLTEPPGIIHLKSPAREYCKRILQETVVVFALTSRILDIKLLWFCHWRCFFLTWKLVQDVPLFLASPFSFLNNVSNFPVWQARHCAYVAPVQNPNYTAASGLQMEGTLPHVAHMHQKIRAASIWKVLAAVSPGCPRVCSLSRDKKPCSVAWGPGLQI